MFLHTASYGVHAAMPFSVYGENLIILVQDIIIIFLFWHYSKDIGPGEKLIFSVAFTGYSYVLFAD